MYLRRQALALGAILVAALPSVALAQLGEAPKSTLDALVDYLPVPAAEGYEVASGFHFTITEADGVAVEVGGTGELSDANMRFLGALIGAASGYGEGIAAPVADFFRTRAAELIGAGEVGIEVMEYLMYVDVDAGSPGSVSMRFTPLYLEPERFGVPAHVIGPLDAAHVIRLFTDLQCPYCAQFDEFGMPVVEGDLLPRGDVRFELHHFPLKSIHANAVVAAEASECVASAAAVAGGHEAGEAAFWTYQSALFSAQQAWGNLGDPLPLFVTLAADLELPSEGLAVCVRSGEFGAAIEESYRVAAQDLRLTGTPTVFVDGLKLGDYRNLEDYLRLMRLGAAISQRETQPQQP